MVVGFKRPDEMTRPRDARKGGGGKQLKLFPFICKLQSVITSGHIQLVISSSHHLDDEMAR